MRKLDTVSCSLNLGLIYNISYSYSHESGVSMTIFFVKESGEYQKPNLLPMQKASIRIGPASFSLYVKSFKISKAARRRVISVDFVDEMFMLDNYYIALTGRGCGKNIYEIGSPVDKRTIEQKLEASLDQVTERIKQFTQLDDIEYSFNDLLSIIRQKFPVFINANYDTNITRATTGTFRAVLSDWCNFFNLSFFFENSQIKIYDPTKLTINIPDQPVDAISYEYSEDIGETYGKTVSRYFEQEGGERPFNNTDGNGTDSTGQSNTIKTLTLYPIGYEFGLAQTSFDLKQVAASMYGKEFWFLYNLANDTLSECGWRNTGVIHGGFKVAEVNDVEFNSKFEAYSSYGRSIAGRWYLSNRINNLDILKDCIWISEADGAVFDVDSNLAKERRIEPDYLEPDNTSVNIIKGTRINQLFEGINFTGKRLAYFDSRDNGASAAFQMSDDLENLISFVFEKAVPDGNSSFNFSGIAGLVDGKKYVKYSPNAYSMAGMPPAISVIMLSISKGEKTQYLSPKYSGYPIKGVRKIDLINKTDLNNQPTEIKPTTSLTGGVISNTGLIRVKKNGAYVVYYDKYSKCNSKSSDGNYFKHHFDIEKISDDNVITYEFNKTADSYSLKRNFQVIDSLLENPYMQSLAQARTFPTKTASFSLNYYYTVPIDFLSNGLIGLNMDIGDDGLTCSYTFSNSVLAVPDKTNEFQLFENSLKNSLIRKYNPKEVIK